MKRLLLCSALLGGITIINSCKKDYTALGSSTVNSNTSVATPSTCFTISALDSSKVSTFNAAKIDSIIKAQASDYFVSVPEGTAISAYKRILLFKNCGTPSDYRIVYTGDPSHIYVADTSKIPTGVTGTQTAISFGDTLRYTYPAAGTYPITVISTNVGDKGRTTNRSVVTKTVILK
jgi:hypothetical protein